MIGWLGFLSNIATCQTQCVSCFPALCLTTNDAFVFSASLLPNTHTAVFDDWTSWVCNDDSCS